MYELYDINSLIEAYGKDAVMSIFLITFLVGAIIALGLFILKAIAICKMAKNRGLKNWWLGIVPYANIILLGKIAGPVRIFKVSVKNMGIILLISTILTDIMNLFSICAIFFADIIGSYALIINTFSYISYLVEIAFYISYFAIAFSIFGKYAPEKRMVYTILSFIQFLFPIFLLVVMNNKPYDSLDDYYRHKMASRYGQTYNPFVDPFQTKENPYSNENSNKNENFEDPFEEFKGD